MDIQYLEKIAEFVRFKYFIAEDVLTVFYVLCAIIILFASWYFLLWIIRRYSVVIKLYKSGRYSLLFSFLIWIISKIKFFRDKIDEKISWHSLSPSQKLKFVALYLLIVGFSELLLRLTFEYLIAYMHMHEWMKAYGLPQ
jgi:hypothetical protein